MTRQILSPPGSHLKGDAAAENTLVVFSDFECGACKTAALETEKLVKAHPKKLNVVYRHYQATPDHLHSELLGQAAEAAGKQGKFWEMHDKLFESQDSLTSADDATVTRRVEAIAKSLGLDAAKFKTDLTSEAVKKAYADDRVLAKRADVKATPTFYLLPAQGEAKPFATIGQLMDWVRTNLKS
jgi:protein-disulfide isomerase